jgi:hypothetical protein
VDSNSAAKSGDKQQRGRRWQATARPSVASNSAAITGGKKQRGQDINEEQEQKGERNETPPRQKNETR